MRKLSTLAFVAVLMSSGAALAQDTIVVDLSGISADVAAELGVDASAVPRTISASAAVAAEACEIPVGELAATCTAVTLTTDLIVLLQASNHDGPGNSNGNSAREFAPGQQDGPARDSAPGQQDGDAHDSAPGQLKKN